MVENTRSTQNGANSQGLRIDFEKMVGSAQVMANQVKEGAEKIRDAEQMAETAAGLEYGALATGALVGATAIRYNRAVKIIQTGLQENTNALLKNLDKVELEEGPIAENIKKLKGLQENLQKAKNTMKDPAASKEVRRAAEKELAELEKQNIKTLKTFTKNVTEEGALDKALKGLDEKTANGIKSACEEHITKLKEVNTILNAKGNPKLLKTLRQKKLAKALSGEKSAKEVFKKASGKFGGRLTGTSLAVVGVVLAACSVDHLGYDPSKEKAMNTFEQKIGEVSNNSFRSVPDPGSDSEKMDALDYCIQNATDPEERRKLETIKANGGSFFEYLSQKDSTIKSLLNDDKSFAGVWREVAMEEVRESVDNEFYKNLMDVAKQHGHEMGGNGNGTGDGNGNDTGDGNGNGTGGGNGNGTGDGNGNGTGDGNGNGTGGGNGNGTGGGHGNGTGGRHGNGTGDGHGNGTGGGNRPDDAAINNMMAEAKPEEAEKSWWERNKEWLLWALGILGVGTLAILGFRKGGWFNKEKSSSSSNATDVVSAVSTGNATSTTGLTTSTLNTSLGNVATLGTQNIVDSTLNAVSRANTENTTAGSVLMANSSKVSTDVSEQSEIATSANDRAV